MKIRNQIYSFLGATIVFAAVSCDSSNPDPLSTLKPLEVDPVVATSTNEFSFSFFQTLQETRPVSENLFVSPLSLHIALGMLVNGAAGETAEEIRTVLKVNTINEGQLNDAYATYLTGLPQVDPQVKLHLANSVWYRNGFQPEQTYLDLLNSKFDAKISGEDFTSPATLNKINQWASDHTMGKIPKVLDKLDNDLVMLLMNALYFKGDWYSQFDKSKTKEADFKLADGSTKKVQMMYGDHPGHAFSTKDAKGVRLAYGGGEYVLTLLMPDEHISLENYLKGLDREKWAGIQAGLQQNQMIIGLPRFQMDYDINLNSTLTKMGMPVVFSDNADFSGISESTDLKVSFVKQNTFLQIDEKGTEAAAVTTIGMVVTSMPAPVKLNMIFDRPFAMIISEKTSDSILFMGRIMNPDSK